MIVGDAVLLVVGRKDHGSKVLPLYTFCTYQDWGRQGQVLRLTGVGQWLFPCEASLVVYQPVIVPALRLPGARQPVRLPGWYGYAAARSPPAWPVRPEFARVSVTFVRSMMSQTAELSPPVATAPPQTARGLGRWFSSWSGVLVLLIATAFFLATAVRADLRVSSAITALLAMVATQLLPGVLIWRSLRPVKGWWIEDVMMGLAIGFMLAIGTQIVAGWTQSALDRLGGRDHPRGHDAGRTADPQPDPPGADQPAAGLVDADRQPDRRCSGCRTCSGTTRWCR